MLRRRPKFKNKNYKIPMEASLDLFDVISILDEESHSNPKEFAKILYDFGIDGDWSLELEYLKLLKRAIRSDYGKKASDLLQCVIDIMEYKNEVK